MIVQCLGDSITYTDPTRADIPYPHKLEMMLGAGHCVGNYGVGGYTVSQIATLWTSSVVGKGGNRLVYMGGINDVVVSTAAATIMTSIDAVVDAALAASWKVVLFTVLPFKNYSGWTAGKQTILDSLNALILAKSATDLIIVDAYSDFESSAGSDTMKAAYDVGDGLHPNQAGSNQLASLAYGGLALLGI